jgi:hypothetical protein
VSQTCVSKTLSFILNPSECERQDQEHKYLIRTTGEKTGSSNIHMHMQQNPPFLEQNMCTGAQQEERRPPPFRRSFLRVDSPNCRYIHIKNSIKWKEQSSRAQQEERRPPPVQQVGRNEEQQYEFQERSSSFSFTFAFPSLNSMTTGEEEEVTSPSFAMNRREHSMKHILSLSLSVLSLSLSCLPYPHFAFTNRKE